MFGQNVVLRHPGKIRIGDNVVIDDNCLLDAKGDTNAGITIGSGVFVGRNTILSCKNGDIALGDRANIGFNCEVFSASRVTVGADTLLAAYCYVIGGDHDFADPSTARAGAGRADSKGVTVGDGVWMGAGAKILDGVTIGGHAIVGAGAVVRVDVPEYAVAAGAPGQDRRHARRATRRQRSRHEHAHAEHPARLRSPRAGRARACTASSACSRG